LIDLIGRRSTAAETAEATAAWTAGPAAAWASASRTRAIRLRSAGTWLRRHIIARPIAAGRTFRRWPTTASAAREAWAAPAKSAARFGFGLIFSNGGSDKNLVPPDHRLRPRYAWYFGRPGEILILGPLVGQFLCRRHRLAIWPAKLWPLLGEGKRRDANEEKECGERSNSHQKLQR
jgi:hypothetical protein